MEPLSYRESGVDLEAADEAKGQMAEVLSSSESRILNGPHAFACLFEATFPGVRKPVLVLKAEEPGSKQLLAVKHGRLRGICFDLIHHLVNDIVVMGAKPEVVLDVILCGHLERAVVVELVAGLAEACRRQGCLLVGGETSEQPGVLTKGVYALQASIMGVVDRDRIIDGAKIAVGDVVVALPSNGLHSNGYALVRRLLDIEPALADRPVGGGVFLDAILRPHRCYYPELKLVLPWPELHGLAHITGGGIQGNVARILPSGIDARIDLSTIRIPSVFDVLRAAGALSDVEMLRTFNMGVGMVAVVAADAVHRFCALLSSKDCAPYVIGEAACGRRQVVFERSLQW